MEEYSELRSLLVQSRQAAENHLGVIKGAAVLTYELVEREITGYLLAKYLLTLEDIPADISFDGLAELSLAKSMQVSPELVKEFDTAKSCDGATSAMAKKVLLFRSIERGLELQLPATRSARLKSLRDFTDMVWETLCDTPVWASRMS